MFLVDEIVQELFQFGFSHLFGMPEFMKPNVMPNPVDIILLSAMTIVFSAD